jgi:hypothetical protein
MRAMDEKPPGGDRRQAGEASFDPIGRLQPLEAQRRGDVAPGDVLHDVSHRRFDRRIVERGAEMDRQLPAAFGFRQTDGRIVGGKILADGVGDAARDLFVGFKPRNPTGLGRHVFRCR